jgi:hypothetical protein
MTRTRQTVYIEVEAKEITIVEVSKKTSIEITLEEAASGVIDLVVGVIYHHRPYNKKNAIYAENLDTN